MPNPQSPSKSGSSAGEETRARLIQAGIEVFGTYGFEGASTRMLAKTAGVNLAAIPYHFGGKEGLYQAVIEYIANKILSTLDHERSLIFQAMADPNASRETLFAALEAIIRGIGATMICSDLGRQFVPIIMREQMHPTTAFNTLYEGRICSIHQAISNFVARLSGLEPESEEAIIRAHTIIGQLISFRVMRETACRRLGWETIDEARTKKVCDVIVANIHRILNPKEENAHD